MLSKVHYVHHTCNTGYIYGNIFKFPGNSRAWFTFCNIYVIYMLMIIHVISQVDVIVLPVPRLCQYWQIMLFSDGVCKRRPHPPPPHPPSTPSKHTHRTNFQGSCLGDTATMLRAPDSLVEVVLEGTSSRTVYSGSLCSSGFGGHPC